MSDWRQLVMMITSVTLVTKHCASCDTNLAVRRDGDPVLFANFLSLHQVACDSAATVVLGGFPRQTTLTFGDF